MFAAIPTMPIPTGLYSYLQPLIVEGGAWGEFDW